MNPKAEKSIPHKNATEDILLSELAAEGGLEASPPNETCTQSQQYRSIHEGSVGEGSGQQLQHVFMELNQDGGYSSHSTCSSCPVDSQALEQMSQNENDLSDQEKPSTTWFEYHTHFLHDYDEIDDILYHFDIFFRGQIDQSIRQLQEKMYSILDEQLIHVRQITAKALKGPQECCDNLQENNNLQPPIKMSRLSTSAWNTVPSNSANSWHNQCLSSECSPQSSFLMKALSNDELDSVISNKKGKEECAADIFSKKQKILIKLLTLTNSVSAMLLKPEYRPRLQ